MERLLEHIPAALIEDEAEIEYAIEAVIEMVIASLLDSANT